MKRTIAIFATALLCAPAFAQRVEQSRAAAAPVARAAAPAVQARSAQTVQPRAAAPAVSARSTAAPRPAAASARTATVAQRNIAPAPVPRSLGEAGRSALAPASASMSNDYNSCRDAYFTCMDQFCANMNPAFRRCACSARIDSLREMERSLKQTGDSLQDFADLHIDAIRMSAAEVAAMVSASVGETAASQTRDKSAAAQTLSGVTSVLNNARDNALSTSGTLDIGGSTAQIWSGSDLIGSADIAALSGRALHDQVHAQCTELALPLCPSRSTLSMAASAYGMYIEQDCNAVLSSLENKKTAAQAATRQVERAVGAARLDTYNAHNSTAINECIAQVRKDITGDGACGPGFVRCLDTSGMYLNVITGAPIYSPNFYRLETMISLSGDPLLNNQNNSFISLLERYKDVARRGLDTCRDVAASVWTEFMRQSLVEIYQAQQSRITKVKSECLDTLNKCYDDNLKNLRDFSNIAEQQLLGLRIELSEELCRDHLTTCSNLYGGGEAGLAELRSLLHGIGTSRISDGCKASLEKFATQRCTPHAANIANIHNDYPWDCRMLAPGGLGATLAQNMDQFDVDTSGNITIGVRPEIIETEIIIIPPPPGGYRGGEDEDETISVNAVVSCQAGNNSIFCMLYNHAKDYCVRPSDALSANFMMPTKVLIDISEVMDDLTSKMRQQLKTVCEKPDFGIKGSWVTANTTIKTCDNVWLSVQKLEFQKCVNIGECLSHDEQNCSCSIDKANEALNFCNSFIQTTNADFDWGYCTRISN
ncbi:MAG: hypothetical protein FWG39_03690 [Alphaproteobacteria bacterium]|nr:hypothetical protein [Alphaproteobacteria bacterium]